MNNISRFDYCFGCGMCVIVCPKKAIELKMNNTGFWVPCVDLSCVDCGICLEVCAFNNDSICEPNDRIEPLCNAAWSNDNKIRYGCTSGGVAYEIGRELLKKGYLVSGVRYDIPNRKAEHFIASSEDSWKASIGSKYIQSYTTTAFSQFIEGNKYFVVGTPCQIDSLRRYVRKRRWEDNFILMDFFCHSVPSWLMWNRYLEMIGVENINRVQFRCKRNGWQNSTSVCVVGDNKVWFSSMAQGDLFYWFFLGDRCPNPSCVTNCKYKQKCSAADLRIGDLWGYKYIDNQKGVNALIAFSLKGERVINQLQTCTFELCDFNTVAELQMKSNAKPKRSYSFVLNALSKGVPLKRIFIIARIIELRDTIPETIVYYFHRIVSIIKKRFCFL